MIVVIDTNVFVSAVLRGDASLLGLKLSHV